MHLWHSETVRCRIHVTGIVQGVGFRPFVYNLATAMRLTGFVGNNNQGVFIELQGEPERLEDFLQQLQRNPPPLSKIASLTREVCPEDATETGFSILASENRNQGAAWIAPDIATCDDCLREMLDPSNRRFRYPFINCTNCGPRFTITLRTPYDRANTTMAGFRMCPACLQEYTDPADRRFHAQPNACPVCGPQLHWLESSAENTGGACRAEDALQAAKDLLRRGGIVAIKGIGGFHLAVDATNHEAVERLRQRKHRFGKPLAVMVRTVHEAQRLAHLTDAAASLLTSRERPIVLLPARAGNGLSSAIAPGTGELGVMLPYSGVHVLLMEEMGPLVMTSGNLSQQPILWEDEAALRGLEDIADGFLLHNRGIHVPCDDSVLCASASGVAPIRRSRGYVPMPVSLPWRGSVMGAEAAPSVLAVGAELKSAFCLTRSTDAFLSQHLGDMESYETMTALERSVQHLLDIFRTQPVSIACDLHPGYLSSQWAARYAAERGIACQRIQHHHAHLASAMADNGCDVAERVIGLIFDGTGYGTDGTIWGGEMLTGDYRGFERRMHLRSVSLPGGDAAAKHPYRAALAYLYDTGLDYEEGLAVVSRTPATERALLRRQMQTGLNAVSSSSMGRLFDAVATIAGMRRSVQFEAQAAIEMEAVAAAPESCDPYPFAVPGGDSEQREIDTRPLIRAVAQDVLDGVSIARISGRFHRTVVEIAIASAFEIRQETAYNSVALSGGVWQNRLIATLAADRLRQHGFRVLEHRLVPCNDGGLALGQAAIACSHTIPGAEELLQRPKL